MSSFKLDLQQIAKISESGETGTIIGRAKYTYCENQYLLRYKAADGRAVESWWSESSLEAV